MYDYTHPAIPEPSLQPPEPCDVECSECDSQDVEFGYLKVTCNTCGHVDEWDNL